MSVHSFTIYDLYKRNAQLSRDKTAILSGETRVTFGDLWNQVNALAGELSSRGVCKGDRIALLTKNSPAFMTILGATAALGAILVPINFRLTAGEVSYILDDAEPVMLLFDREYEKLMAELVSVFPSISERIPFDSQQVSPFPIVDRQTFLEEVAASDPLVIIHTAAIQGKPRGAVISHGNLLAGMSQTVGVIGLDSGDIYLNILPLFHIFGLIMALSLMQVAGENVWISSLRMLERAGYPAVGRLPFSLKVLLENLLRHEDGRFVKREDIEALSRWDPSRPDGQPRRALDTSRARERFDFVATTSFEDGLRATIDSYETSVGVRRLSDT